MKRKLKRTLGYSYLMGGTALLSGALPTPMKEPVGAVATQGSKFVGPIVAVTGAGIVVNQLRKLKPKKRKRRSK